MNFQSCCPCCLWHWCLSLMTTHSDQIPHKSNVCDTTFIWFCIWDLTQVSVLMCPLFVTNHLIKAATLPGTWKLNQRRLDISVSFVVNISNVRLIWLYIGELILVRDLMCALYVISHSVKTALLSLTWKFIQINAHMRAQFVGDSLNWNIIWLYIWEYTHGSKLIHTLCVSHHSATNIICQGTWYLTNIKWCQKLMKMKQRKFYRVVRAILQYLFTIEDRMSVNQHVL